VGAEGVADAAADGRLVLNHNDTVRGHGHSPHRKKSEIRSTKSETNPKSE